MSLFRSRVVQQALNALEGMLVLMLMPGTARLSILKRLLKDRWPIVGIHQRVLHTFPNRRVQLCRRDCDAIGRAKRTDEIVVDARRYAHAAVMPHTLRAVQMTGQRRATMAAEDMTCTQQRGFRMAMVSFCTGLVFLQPRLHDTPEVRIHNGRTGDRDDVLFGPGFGRDDSPRNACIFVGAKCLQSLPPEHRQLALVSSHLEDAHNHVARPALSKWSAPQLTTRQPVLGWRWDAAVIEQRDKPTGTRTACHLFI